MDSHIIIAGPTASGKSSLAIELAQQIGAEVVSVDAFQIYRGLDVGTGKVTTAEMQGVPHHLLSIVDPEQEFSVADYVRAAEALVAQISAPLIWAGGTGLYVSALLEGLTPAPPTPKEIQDELNQRSTASLRAEIQRVDPHWAAQADLENPRRMIRALGVYLATGQTMSQWQQQRTPGLLQGAKVFCLQQEPERLRDRITRRVAAMLAGGWIDEVQQLAERLGWESSQASRAIGYAEVLWHLRGQLSFEECRAAIEQQTWQYARRQRTWFRKQQGVIPLESSDLVSEILQQTGGG